MVKSVLGGALTGVVVSAIALSTASLIAEQPPGAAPPAPPQQAVPDGPAPGAPDSPATPAAPPPQGAASPVGTPEAPRAPAHPGASGPVDTTPAAAPAPGTAPRRPDAPAAGTDTTRPRAATGVLPAPQGAAPAVPVSESDISVSTDPAQPRQPDPQPGGDPAPAGLPDSPSEPPLDGTGEVAPPPPVADAADPAQAPEGALRSTPPVSRIGTTDALPDEITGDSDPRVRAAPSGQSTFAPTPPLTEREAEAPEAEAPQGALATHAAPFAPRPDMPMLSVVLIDQSGQGLGPTAVAALPFPVSVAIDPGAADARQRAFDYRSAGLEVVALADIPARGTPQDVAQALEATFATLPEAVALVDLAPLGLGSERDVVAAAAERLARDGRGLVSSGGGLNASLRAAERSGVPGAEIYRDLDRDGQDARVIRRFLDQAAFRARNEGGVVLVARLRADTLSALDLWSLAERAQTVQLAPVSAQLLAR